MDKLQTLHAFWNGFGIPAFDENTVPDEKERIERFGAAYPYITYEAADDFFGNTVVKTATLWYRSSSWAEITEKEQQISEYITRGGRMLKYDGGAMWIQRASPWAQRLDEPSDDTIRAIVLNYELEFMD